MCGPEEGCAGGLPKLVIRIPATEEAAAGSLWDLEGNPTPEVVPLALGKDADPHLRTAWPRERSGREGIAEGVSRDGTRGSRMGKEPDSARRLGRVKLRESVDFPFAFSDLEASPNPALVKSLPDPMSVRPGVALRPLLAAGSIPEDREESLPAARLVARGIDGLDCIPCCRLQASDRGPSSDNISAGSASAGRPVAFAPCLRKLPRQADTSKVELPATR
jgi:hypothetical protein